MFTLSVDDRQLVVNAMQRILQRIDPTGSHRTATDAATALSLAEQEPVDVAFLDVEMPGMDGIELAGRLQELYPLVNIIFITGYEEYMPQAFKLFASGYIVKPVTESAVVNALSHLRYRAPQGGERPVRVQCFGNFEVYVQGEPVRFTRSKCKELLAYLIDRQGAICDNDMVMGNLWPDSEPTDSRKSMYRVIVAELAGTLNRLGAGEIIVRDNRGVRVDVNKVECDYYRYLAGDPYALHQYHGEYMTQYELGEVTRANLLQKLNRI